MSSHTTGEWIQNKKNGRLIECDGRKIVTANSTPWDAQEAWANARLIAAAPELLKVARRCLAVLETVGVEHWTNIMQDTRAVIAKAEGQQ